MRYRLGSALATCAAVCASISGCAGSGPTAVDQAQEEPMPSAAAITPTITPGPPATRTVVAPSPESGGDPVSLPPGVPRIAAGLVPLPTQPPDVPWPTEAWPTGPVPDYIDAVGLDMLLASTFEGAAYGEIHAALLIIDGQLIVERYGNGYLGDDPHVSRSVSKSVTHAMLGVLVKDGRLDMTAPAAVAEWVDDERSAITPDMLLTMTSGLDWFEPLDTIAVGLLTDGPIAADYQTSRALVHDPGTNFNYSSGSTAVLGRVMGDLVGTGDEFDAWARDVLFDPIGIGAVDLGFDGDGYFNAGVKADMNARDYARLGLLYIRDGVWDGVRILPEGWVDYGRSPPLATDEYGAGFWLNDPPAFRAQGLEGQFVIMNPEHDIVFVLLSRNPGDRSLAFIRNFARLIDFEAAGEG